MIVVDSSALLSILLSEADCAVFQDALVRSERSLLSAVNAHETATVLRLRHGQPAVDLFWTFLSQNHIEIVAFDERQVRACADAFNRFEKGIHKARLNLSDCAAYALAKTMGAPLLFKGDDFPQTDIEAAV